MIKGIFIIDKWSEEKIDKIVDLGANAVFTGYKNLKKNLMRKLQKKGIKIYVEIGLFTGEELWQKYPDSRPASRKNDLMEKIDWYAGVCPNNSQVRKEKIKIIKSLIDDCKVDGIWLDFIRYPCHWEVLKPNLTEYCFCSNCLEKFKQEIGGEPEEKKWVQWKCDQIANFVADARDLIDQNGKNIQLGLFSVPWRKTDFKGAIEKIIGQDLKSLSRYIDVFTPMTYQKMCGKKVQWIYEISNYMRKMTNKSILPIIQTEDKPKKIFEEEFRQSIAEAMKKPSSGVIVFFLEDLLKDKDKLSGVKEAFKAC